MLSLLWEEEDVNVRRVLTGNTVSDSETALLVNRLSQLPFTVDLKSSAWYKLLQNRNISNLTLKDWKNYEPLIPYLSTSYLSNINFSDDDILEYFGKQKFSLSQLSVMAEAVQKRRGENVLNFPKEILQMGNIFCGFPIGEIMDLSTSTLRYLMDEDFFEDLQGCTKDRLEVLAKAVQCYAVIGPPSAWDGDTIKKAGFLLSVLNTDEMRAIRDQSFSEVTPEVISNTPPKILKSLRDDQLRALSKDSLIAWRRNTKDFRHIYLESTSSSLSNNLFIIIPCTFFCIKM